MEMADKHKGGVKTLAVLGLGNFSDLFHAKKECRCPAGSEHCLCGHLFMRNDFLWVFEGDRFNRHWAAKTHEHTADTVEDPCDGFVHRICAGLSEGDICPDTLA